MALVNHMIHTVQAEMLNHYLIVAISLVCLPALAQPAYALGQTQSVYIYTGRSYIGDNSEQPESYKKSQAKHFCMQNMLHKHHRYRPQRWPGD